MGGEEGVRRSAQLTSDTMFPWGMDWSCHTGEQLHFHHSSWPPVGQNRPGHPLLGPVAEVLGPLCPPAGRLTHRGRATEKEKPSR